MLTDNKAKRSPRRGWLVAACAALLACGLLAGLAGCSCGSDQNQGGKQETEKKAEDAKTPPNVVGMTKDDAARVIADAGFKVGKVTEEESDKVVIGMVVSQKPGSGTEAKLGSTIDYVVSKGVKKTPAQVAVPNLAGMTQTQAEDVLAKAKLVSKAGDPVYADGVEPGKIFKQSVAPDTKVEEGTAVSFVVALGKEVVAVPNVVNMAKDAAIKTLTGASFNVDLVEMYSSSVAAGNVIGQNPNPRIQCVKGTTVTLSISKGAAPAPKEQVAMPDFMTLTVEQAEAICSNAGLKCVFTGADSGAVVAQSIVAGTKVDRGTTVTLTIEELPTLATEG